jgi:hypothetical protein
MHVDAGHIQDFISNGQARLASVNHSRDFGSFLNNSMPWNRAGTALMWDDIPHVSLNLAQLPNDNLLEAVARTGIAQHSLTFVMFSPAQPGLICELKFALENVDALYWLTPANRYMCGVDVVDETMVPIFEDLCEYSGNQYLTLTI